MHGFHLTLIEVYHYVHKTCEGYFIHFFSIHSLKHETINGGTTVLYGKPVAGPKFLRTRPDFGSVFKLPL